MKHPFEEKDGLFSWRKALTAITAFVFAYACIAFLHGNKFVELPYSYVGIIAGVFAFYFLKDAKSPFKLTKNE